MPRFSDFAPMKTWITAVVLLALAIAGLYWHGHRDGSAPKAGPGGYQMPPPVVEVTPVVLGAVSRTVEAVGTLRANESVTVRPEIAGRVVAIGFSEGQKVRKGVTLITLDDSVYRAEVAEKSAARKLSELAFERAKLLVEKKAASIEVKDRAQAQLEADDAALQLARARLDKTRILAPFDGAIGLRTVSVGDFVDVGQVLVNLVDIDLLKVDFRVGEVYLPDVTTGQDIAVKVDAFPTQEFKGTVYAIEPEVDVNGRAVVIRARLPNSENKLRPGLFSKVTLIVDSNAQAMLVPEDAIVPQGDQHFIYRVVDGRALLTEVLIGKRKDTRVEIRSGLNPGDLVVTAGQLKLRDGVAVQTTDSKDAVAKAAPAAAPAAEVPGTAKDS
jgi:membrane fusion protein, multidrug efflux system